MWSKVCLREQHDIRNQTIFLVWCKQRYCFPLHPTLDGMLVHLRAPHPCPQQYGTGTKFSRYHAFKFSRLGLGVAAFKREVQRPFCFTIVTPLHLCSLLMKKRKKPGRYDFIAFPDKLLPRLFWFRFTLQMVLFSFERSGFFFFFGTQIFASKRIQLRFFQ